MSKILAIVILALIAYNVMSSTDLMKHTGGLMDTLTGGAAPDDKSLKSTKVDVGNHNVLPFPQISNNFASQGTFKSETNHVKGFSSNEVTAEDLLPREGGFNESNPTTQGTLSNRNLFEAGHHAGLNTQLNSLRNGNQQLRSDPLIPRVAVGPWSQSTYEADTNRREFEIGGV